MGYVELVLPKVERQVRHSRRKRHPDRPVFQGILFMLHAGIVQEHLPQELGFGSGMTFWRRLAEWTKVGAWPRFHEALLAKLRSLDALDFSHAVADGSHIWALRGPNRNC
ncbi:transposase [Streptomyces californicus]|uniref:transposase n=1 Tax=Streptomyces californicus TaxID=67351 RepID=UPI0036A787AD